MGNAKKKRSTKQTKVVKNKDLGKVMVISKQFPLNLNEDETKHTNVDGSEVTITEVTDEMYFSKRIRDEHSESKGSSWMFPNHLEYAGWLGLNGFVNGCVD